MPLDGLLAQIKPSKPCFGKVVAPLAEHMGHLGLLAQLLRERPHTLFNMLTRTIEKARDIYPQP
jgi:hypothetical protein